MFKRILFFLWFFAVLIILGHPVTFAQEKYLIAGLEPFDRSDNILILAPHPDDETICCGGVIQQALAAGAKVKVVFLTSGDSNEVAFIVYEKRLTFEKKEFLHMGQVRMQEAVAAAKVLGLKESDLIFLGYPDFGTFKMFSQYWQKDKPYVSVATKVSSVPYKQSYSFGAPYVGESALTDLEKIISEYKPDKIFVSHPADVNSDHKTFYLFLQIALLDLRDDMRAPEVYFYLTHCTGWPAPWNYHPGLSLNPPKKFSGSDISWKKLELSSQEVDKKYRALLCHKSETESSNFYLSAFLRKNELFSDYPEIELKVQVLQKEKDIVFSSFSMMAEPLEDSKSCSLAVPSDDLGTAGYALVGDSLFIKIQKTKNLGSLLGTQIYLFGYNEGIPFAKMPKIRIIVKNKGLKVFDKRTLIKSEGVSLDFGVNTWVLKVPLRVLGDPQFILASVRAYNWMLSEESLGFRKIRISR